MKVTGREIVQDVLFGGGLGLFIWGIWLEFGWGVALIIGGIVLIGLAVVDSIKAETVIDPK
jgi:hypothetical protein